MDTDSAGAEARVNEETVPGKAGRPRPIILTSKSNLIQLQKQLKDVVKGDFEFRNTKNGTRVIRKSLPISKPSNPTYRAITSLTSPSSRSPRNP
jgi:hypothetical protein